jgi:hypothetical protein
MELTKFRTQHVYEEASSNHRFRCPLHIDTVTARRGAVLRSRHCTARLQASLHKPDLAPLRCKGAEGEPQPVNGPVVGAKNTSRVSLLIVDKLIEGSHFTQLCRFSGGPGRPSGVYPTRSSLRSK